MIGKKIDVLISEFGVPDGIYPRSNFQVMWRGREATVALNYHAYGKRVFVDGDCIVVAVFPYKNVEPISKASTCNVLATGTETTGTNVLSAFQNPGLTKPPGFALIPSGEFMMGDALDGEKSLRMHKVNVSAFFIQKTEVTKAQWDDVRAWALKHGYTDLPKGEGKAADHPVQNITWYDTVKWCNARSQMEGLVPCYYTDDTLTEVYQFGEINLSSGMVKWHATGYRLPTEAEWEKAARGGLRGNRFSNGDAISHALANFNDVSKEEYLDPAETKHTRYHSSYENGGVPYTSPVGSFPANAYGLSDIGGNVYELCWDTYDDYPLQLQTDPKGPASRALRVCRGGAWDVPAYYCRVAGRRSVNPGNSDNDLGFRTARSYR